MAAELQKKDKREVREAAAEQLQYSGTAYRPDVDIYTSEDEVIFITDLPGVSKGDVSVEIDETDTLVIRAKNSFVEPNGVILRQFNSGNYYRAFKVSNEYDKNKISAKLENGALEITIPKRDEVKPRKIEIKA